MGLFLLPVTTYAQSPIPSWIKNNAGWWAEGQIDDTAFLQGIQFLIKEGIMIIPPTESSGASESQGVPSWIKNNAGWWAEGQIDDTAFLQGIQFLIKNSIIVIDSGELNTELTIETKSSESDVIIVGAGISGLTAATTLESEGYDVIVLEARDRTGGRMWSHTWNGIIIDEGANWIHTSDGNPITEFAKKNNFELLRDPSSSVLYWNGVEIDEDDYDELINDMLNYFERKGQTTNADTSLVNAFNQFKATKNLSEEDNTILDYLFHSRIEQEYATDSDNLSLWWWNIGDEYGEGEYILPGGYDQIIGVIEEGIDIRLEHVVTEIKYDSNGVTVHTDKGIFSSDVVLVTVPLGVLKSGDIVFSPELPAAKQRAIDNLGMGMMQKHWLLFDEIFWDDDVSWILSVSDDPHWECVNFTYTGKPILLCFTVGEYAITQEKLPDDNVTSDAMKFLRSAYGDDIPEPIDVYITNWAFDKFSYGAYSYTTIGSNPNTYQEIAKPVKNIVFFAGEHTSEYPATVHGAYLSGIREAERIQNLD